LNNRNLLKVLAALALVAIFIVPYIALGVSAQTTQGKPVTEITFVARTSQQTALLETASGKADIFLWSMPLGYYKSLSPTVASKLRLIRTTTTYYSLALNPANNVYDPNAPGIIQLKDQNITSKVLPGLLL